MVTMDRRDLRGVLALGAGAALLLCFDAGTRVLASNDEARFAVLGRNVLRHGTWLVPSLGDAPYLNKPPLVAWLIALVSWPAGDVTQRTAVWPSLLAALGVVLLTWWIGRRLWGQAVGLTAGFLVLTMHGLFTYARVSMPDVVLCLALTGAMAAYVASAFGERPRAMLLCHLCLALGFLAKGPAVLLGLIVIGAHSLMTREDSVLRRLAPLRGAPLIVVVVAPWWLMAMHSRGAAFVHETVVVDWLEWFKPHVTAGTLVAPVTHAFEVALPWSVLLPIALVAIFLTRVRAPALALPQAWLGTVFAVVALSHQQRMRYYLPLCPATALLVAIWFHHAPLTRCRARVRWAAAAAVVLGLVAWELRDDARHDAGTNLHTVSAVAARDDLPLYTLGVPNLVASFYVDRPVVAIDAKSLADGRLAPGYFLVDDHARSSWPTGCSVERLGGGAANGRPFSVWRLAPPGCGGTKGGSPSAG